NGLRLTPPVFIRGCTGGIFFCVAISILGWVCLALLLFAQTFGQFRSAIFGGVAALAVFVFAFLFSNGFLGLVSAAVEVSFIGGAHKRQRIVRLNHIDTRHGKADPEYLLGFF